MQQVEQFLAGERDYSLIKGDTGPLVYPALHVYIYSGLHAITQSGTNIVLAQVWFATLYVFNLGIAMLCYYAAGAPPYVYPMLVLSKRLHSIYVLRCFNDGFAMTGFFLAVYFYQRKYWTAGTLAFAAGLGVKMSLLLALPAVGTILLQAIGPASAFTQLVMIGQVQVCRLPHAYIASLHIDLIADMLQFVLAFPFARSIELGKIYLSRAFDLSRVFKYQWSVNWRFVSEETFLSREFAIGLLVAHVVLLMLFVFTRWLQPLRYAKVTLADYLATGVSTPTQVQIRAAVTPDFVLTTMTTAMALGMLFARSLHYQFFAWIAWATPFLLYKSKLHPILQLFLWSGQELAWNQYPPNELASKIIVGVLAITVLYAWIGTDDAIDPKEVFRKVKEHSIEEERKAREASKKTS